MLQQQAEYESMHVGKSLEPQEIKCLGCRLTMYLDTWLLLQVGKPHAASQIHWGITFYKEDKDKVKGILEFACH